MVYTKGVGANEWLPPQKKEKDKGDKNYGI